MGEVKDEIRAAVETLDPKAFEPVVRKAADELYEQIMGTCEDYLRENVEWNIGSLISMLERENQQMRTELYEVDRTLGGVPLGHESRIKSIQKLESDYVKATAELWELRKQVEQPL